MQHGTTHVTAKPYIEWADAIVCACMHVACFHERGHFPLECSIGASYRLATRLTVTPHAVTLIVYRTKSC